MDSIPNFLPFSRMNERLRITKEDSDIAYFYDLMLFGEFILKMICSGIVAGIEDDPERHRYRIIYNLVRTDGLGDWSKAIDEVLTGTSSQYISITLHDEQKELTQRLGDGHWQNTAVNLIFKCLCLKNNSQEKLPSKVQGKSWFQYFVELRNKTRGHGAITGQMCSMIVPELEQSIMLFVQNFKIFQRSWAFLHRNYSGKYRVTKWTKSSEFDYLKTSHATHHITLIDGVYLFLNRPYRTDLICSNVDATDFYFPNGNFNGKTYELLSYISDDLIEGDAAQYLLPPSELPKSETQGLGSLDIQEKCFGNLPPLPNNYIQRPGLEKELLNHLLNDRHPVVTLTGRGGIGKTSLALYVLWELAKKQRYDAILWFSARDIDLSLRGAKLVKPHILSDKDIAKEFSRLLEPLGFMDKEFDHLNYFMTALTKSPVGSSLLFVFDNFETVNSPVDLYTWIDTYVRLPNKILITTRVRDFKGDYPVEVMGMNVIECHKLIMNTAQYFGISHLINQEYEKEIYNESDGHPYVIKILLGEVAKAKKRVSIQRIVANQNEILDALFERTFNNLSPGAKRIFVTLCDWNSVYPKVAVEAVILRPSNEKMDPDAAIEELSKSSFIEIIESKKDEELFINVPLVAAIFGKRKLAVFPDKNIIKEDSALLKEFGAIQSTDIQHGLQPRVVRMFQSISHKIQDGNSLKEKLPILEFIAQKYPPAWLLLANLFEETDSINDLDKTKKYIRAYLEITKGFNEQQKAWKKLSEVCRRTDDWLGELNALIERICLEGAPYNILSSSIKRINSMFRQIPKTVHLDDLATMIKPLIEKMLRQQSEADSFDCSNMAWLCVQTRQKQQAKEFVKIALEKNPDNHHCISLKKVLKKK